MEIFGNKLIEGIFIEENKNRFICRVLVENQVCECYVPSSSRLGNFINLKNKRVLLSINSGRNTRTKFSLFAVFYRNRAIMLNLNIVNKLVEVCICGGQYKEYLGYDSIAREIDVNGYKADLYIEGHDKIIIENKSIISLNKEASFPTVYSERSIAQLKKLYFLLKDGYKVNYNFIALSPFTHTVEVNKDNLEYYWSFMDCISIGMVAKAYNINFADDKLISRDMSIIY